MSNRVIRTTKMIYPQIYAYTLPTVSNDIGWIKIGYTEHKNVDDKIKGQMQTTTVNLDFLNFLSEPSELSASDDWFNDKQLHVYLCKKKNAEKQINTEWFSYNWASEKPYADFDDECIELFGKKL